MIYQSDHLTLRSVMDVFRGETNDIMICEWSLPQSIASKQCDECFFSCACFMGTCPQNMILNKNTYACSGFLEGIESIIKWIAKTEKIDVL